LSSEFALVLKLVDGNPVSYIVAITDTVLYILYIRMLLHRHSCDTDNKQDQLHHEYGYII
jgi:hypothetical protein